MTTVTETEHTPFTCELCEKPITTWDEGALEWVDTTTGGYPTGAVGNEPVKLESAPQGLRTRSGAEIATAPAYVHRIDGREDVVAVRTDAPPLARVRVTHTGWWERAGLRQGYAITLNRIRRADQLHEWLLQLAGKTWIGKRELAMVVRDWYRLRGLDLPQGA